MVLWNINKFTREHVGKIGYDEAVSIFINVSQDYRNYEAVEL